MKRDISIGENTHSVALIRKPTGLFINIDDADPQAVQLEKLANGKHRITVGDISAQALVEIKGENIFIEAFGQVFELQVLDPVEQAHSASQAGDLSAKAPMPGMVVELHVKQGDTVAANQPLVTIESMKLMTIIRTPGAGIVSALNVNEGDLFNKGVVLVKVEPQENGHA